MSIISTDATLNNNADEQVKPLKMGMFRTTFIINESGIINRIFFLKEIKNNIHAEQILNI